MQNVQNVQNAAEIQQRVINLVEFYRTKVGGTESENYKAACEYEQAEEQKQIEAQKKKHARTISTSVTIPENLANKLKVNEQLLGHFYIKVFGVNADERVANELFANYYDDSVFTKAEENFLISCFKEMVSYIISTPCNNLSSKDWDEKDIFYVPKEVLDYACENMHIPDNAIIYNPFAGFAQFATELNNCRFICEDSYSAFREQDNIIDNDHDVSAWTEVILAANGIENIIYSDDNNILYDAIMSYVPFIPKSYVKEKNPIEEKFELYLCSVFVKAYNSLKDQGEMRLIIPNETLWKGNSNYSFKTFWETVMKDGSLSEIIQLPSVLSYNCHHEYCLVKIIKKSNSIISIIDARFALRELSNNNVISMKDLSNENAEEQFLETGVPVKFIKNGEGNVLMAKQGAGNFIMALDTNKLKEVKVNEGKEPETGLRKAIKIDASKLNLDLLIPQVYVIEKPSSEEKPVPLSTFCSLVTTRIRDIKYDLPKDTLWIKEKNLAYTYQGAINMESGDIEKADCHNNPPHTDDYVFNDQGELDTEFPWSQKTAIGERVAGYRECYFLDGNKDAILYKLDKQGVKLGLIRATGKPLAIDKDIIVFTPKESIDSLQLYVLLNMPLVYRQVQEIRNFGINNNLHNVLVPSDRRIIIDAERKASNEERAYKAQEAKLMGMKTEYINEVRMRKHDMGQYIFELVNIENLMRYYVENRDKEENFCQELENLLDNFRSSLGELSTLLANLSKEEQFGEPEMFNIDSFLSKLSTRYKADGFIINYSCDESSIKRYNWKHLRADSLEDALIDAQILDYDDEMALEDALIDAQIQAHDDEVALEDAMIDAQIQAHDDEVALEDAMIEAQIQAHDDEVALEDAMIEAQIQAYDDEMVLEDALIDAQIQAYDDEIAYIDDALADEEAAYVDDFIGDDESCVDDILDNNEPVNIDENINLQNMTKIPSIHISPNDIQRAVNNIIDNARKHGFTDHNRNDYEVRINMSIDIEKNMFLVDFLNNGNPLPEGMDKMRYGIKGEKAGKTGGTGIGGSYIKKFVEHYGGDYDVFMDNGWTVIRIYLPIR